LVVDDDAAVRVSTARMLQTLGYEVWSAADAEAADTQARAPERRLDFLVCDLALPPRDGVEIAAAIRLLHPAIKVLFISGYPRGAARGSAVDDFLQKPYDRDAIARKLAALTAAASD
jgi:CheY-like chemotaxis protein